MFYISLKKLFICLIALILFLLYFHFFFFCCMFYHRYLHLYSLILTILINNILNPRTRNIENWQTLYSLIAKTLFLIWIEEWTIIYNKNKHGFIWLDLRIFFPFILSPFIKLFYPCIHLLDIVFMTLFVFHSLSCPSPHLPFI